MVEDVGTGEDFLAGFGVDEIVQGDEQSALGQGIWNHLPHAFPEPCPRQFGRVHEGVEAAPVHVELEKDLQRSEQIGGARRSEVGDDGNQGVNKQSGPFFTMSGRRERGYRGERKDCV